MWRSTRTWRSRLWEKCLLVYHTLFYRSLGEYRDTLLAWVIHEMIWTLDLSGGFQRCERGQVKRTFVVNGFGDHRLESCYCTQYYCWWLFYPALANPLIGSYFSHSCVPQSHGFPWTKYISLISVPFIFIAVLVYDTLWSSFVLEHLLGHINWFFEKRTSHTKRQTFGKAMR